MTDIVANITSAQRNPAPGAPPPSAPTPAPPAPSPAPTPTPAPSPSGMVQMSEEVSRMFAEMQDRHAAETKRLSEQIDNLNAERQTKRFTDIVTGRGGANDGRPWLGSPAEHVAMLSDLTRAFGEDSEQVKRYVTQNRALAAQAATANLFTEFGSSGTAAPDSAAARFDAEVAKFQEANPKLTRQQAVARVSDANPRLFNEYDAERKSGARRGV